MTQTSELHNVLKAGQFQVKESILFTTGIKNLRPFLVFYSQKSNIYTNIYTIIVLIILL